METDQYNTVVNTSADGRETEDTDPTVAADTTGVVDTTVVAEAEPMEEDIDQEYSNQKDKDYANVTKRLQKEKNRRSAYFDINEYLPERRGYRLRDRNRREISLCENSTDNLLLLQNYMEQLSLLSITRSRD